MTEQQLAAMRQALEALIAASGHVNNEVFVKVMMARDALNDALRTAIEQAETAQGQSAERGEPVALETVYETIIHWDEGGGKRSRRELARRIVDLYTTPPAAPVQEPPFRFRRFVAGSERAEDVVIERETTIEAAARKAAKICPPSPMTVLVYDPPAAQRQWVGLDIATLEEGMRPHRQYESAYWLGGFRAGALWADAKLREKNGIQP